MCDDHRMFTDALAVALEGRGYRVVERVYSANEAAAASRHHDVDVCLIDRYFPDGDGLEVIPDILAASPRTRVVMLSGSSDPSLAALALGAGASGVVVKHYGIGAIIDAIEGVRNGGHQPSRRNTQPAHRREGRSSDPIRFLTGRELQVLALLVQGKPTVDIGREMGITYSTTRTHIQSLLTKLGAHSKLEAVTLAVAQEITSEK